MKNIQDYLEDKNNFQFILDAVPLHIVITDEEGEVVLANKAVELITGYSKNEIIGNNPRLWGRQMDEEFYKEFWKTIKDDKKTFRGVVTNKRKDGRKYQAAVRVTPVLDDDKNVIGFCGVEQDITEIQEMSDLNDLGHKYRKLMNNS